MSSLAAQESPEAPNKLREFREAAGLSQERLAAWCGLSYSTIRRIEARGGSPTLTTARKIAAALQATVTEIWPEMAE